MPQPPLLNTIDWKAVHASGIAWEDWIAGAASEKNRDAMLNILAEQRIEPHIAALLQGLPRAVNVVAIAEDWCGDVVRHVPVLQRIAQACPQLNLAFVTREQHKEVFVRYLTNGGEAIPKFIFLSDQFVECGNWGPDPRDCYRIMSRGKGSGNMAAARAKVTALYQADEDRRIVVEELVEHIGIASAIQP